MLTSSEIPTTAPTSKSIGTRYLTLGTGLTVGLKLYNTSVAKEGSGLHRSCPYCIQAVTQQNVCSNEQCSSNEIMLVPEQGEHFAKFPMPIRGEVIKAFRDGEMNIEVKDEELDALMIPLANGEMEPFPNKDHFVIHGRLSEKEALKHLLNTTGKYYLQPEKGPSITLYAGLLKSLAEKKQTLMIKFCMRTQRQQLAIIHVENKKLVMSVVPFAAQLRIPPEVKVPENVEPRFVALMSQLITEIPETPFEEARDDYDTAFNFLVENKIKAFMESMLPKKGNNRKVKAKPAPTSTESLLMQAVEKLKKEKLVTKSKAGVA